MSNFDQAQSTNIPIVVTQQEISQQGIFNQTSKTLGWYQYFPESNGVATQELSTHDQQMFFIVKLYAFLAGLFIFQYLMVIMFYYCEQFRWSLIIFDYPQPLYWAILGVTIMLGMIAYFIKQSRNPPINLIISMLYSFGVGCVLQAPYADSLWWNESSLLIILYQFCMTLCTFGTLIAYKLQDSQSANGSYLLLMAFLLDLFVILIFILTYVELAWLIVISIIVHVIYACLLLFETQLIQRGKFNLGLNEYISGALFIYIEVTLFFMFVAILFVVFMCVALVVLIGTFIVHKK
ncbi:unnamed protein product (macronuclear) [Paramecium tetraurelia]|uniref:Uncharacterized protein n=1 Tax=Paramecium tetraurelia TaxID=5888 RepID=A0CGA8_PARTE|nr:uncharacterized protein GSPATT00038270001 [Paramecium tetraurelia]CAK69825.1 unnamed protein product [Paramecium tetraurelia]|eukprot:XP_001437222.1 hypothetical protein (macronuclear) [Paramecium tetraurelia strain d4-2]